MKKRTITLLAAPGLLLFATNLEANNIRVSNTKLSRQNTDTDCTFLAIRPGLRKLLAYNCNPGRWHESRYSLSFEL